MRGEQKKGLFVLQRLYQAMMRFADKPSAIYMLGLISFAESSFFPLPPDPLLITIALKNPQKIWRLAFLCTLTSVAGGWLGYAIGYALYESLGTLILETYGLQEGFARFQAQFQEWGFWLVAAKGLTPIPYKIVTIACGVIHLDLLTFTLASCVARGFRFFLLASLLHFYGPSLKNTIEKNLGWATLLFLSSLIGGILILKLI